VAPPVVLDPEAIIQQLGQGVMNELSKVVDTVSTDLKLVTEQLKNLSTSMNESMMMTSMLKDQDLSTSLSHSFTQGPGRGGALPPTYVPLVTPEKQNKGTERSGRGRGTGRYDNSVDQPSLSDDSHLLPPPPVERNELSRDDEVASGGGLDDHALAEMIREGLKVKLFGLVSQSMTLRV
jgi:hypothetical protein